MRRGNGDIPEERTSANIKTRQQPEHCVVDGLVCQII